MIFKDMKFYGGGGVCGENEGEARTRGGLVWRSEVAALVFGEAALDLWIFLILRIHSQLTIFWEASSCRAASEFPDLPRRNSSRDT